MGKRLSIGDLSDGVCVAWKIIIYGQRDQVLGTMKSSIGGNERQYIMKSM